jgi:hypothetical protein
MDALHARAKDENHLVQVINGINWVSANTNEDKPDAHVNINSTVIYFFFSSTIDSLDTNMR